MFEPVKVTIGGTEYSVPTALNFPALKRCQPHLAKISTDKPMDMIDMAEVGIEVIAAAFAATQPELTVEAIQSRVTAPDMPRISEAITEIMIESGYWKKKSPSGEGQPPKAAKKNSPTLTE